MFANDFKSERGTQADTPCCISEKTAFCIVNETTEAFLLLQFTVSTLPLLSVAPSFFKFDFKNFSADFGAEEALMRTCTGTISLANWNMDSSSVPSTMTKPSGKSIVYPNFAEVINSADVAQTASAKTKAKEKNLRIRKLYPKKHLRS